MRSEVDDNPPVEIVNHHSILDARVNTIFSLLFNKIRWKDEDRVAPIFEIRRLNKKKSKSMLLEGLKPRHLALVAIDNYLRLKMSVI